MTDDRAARSIDGEGQSLEIAGITDRGPVRTQNQDVWDARIGPGGGNAVLALADGMGGHKGGLESAEAAVTAAMAVLTDADHPEDAAATLRQAVAAANDAVAVARVSIGGNPGTTLVLAIIEGAHASVANVGDSRAYLISGATARQITDDHSWAAGQVRLGAIDEAEARHHPKRNLIERAVMGDPGGGGHLRGRREPRRRPSPVLGRPVGAAVRPGARGDRGRARSSRSGVDPRLRCGARGRWHRQCDDGRGSLAPHAIR